MKFTFAILSLLVTQIASAECTLALQQYDEISKAQEIVVFQEVNRIGEVYLYHAQTSKYSIHLQYSSRLGRMHGMKAKVDGGTGTFDFYVGNQPERIAGAGGGEGFEGYRVICLPKDKSLNNCVDGAKK